MAGNMRVPDIPFSGVQLGEALVTCTRIVNGKPCDGRVKEVKSPPVGIVGIIFREFICEHHGPINESEVSNTNA